MADGLRLGVFMRYAQVLRDPRVVRTEGWERAVDGVGSVVWDCPPWPIDARGEWT